MKIHIYTDGCSIPNPGPSGSGILFNESLWYGMYEEKSTNNRAELVAILHAMMLCDPSTDNYILHSDSQYAINCITKWAKNWENNGWETSSKKHKGGHAVKNQDVIEPAYNTYKSLKFSLEMKWLRGHTGHNGNDMADTLAVMSVISRRRNLTELTGKARMEFLTSDHDVKDKPSLAKKILRHTY